MTYRDLTDSRRMTPAPASAEGGVYFYWVGAWSMARTKKEAIWALVTGWLGQ